MADRSRLHVRACEDEVAKLKGVSVTFTEGSKAIKGVIALDGYTANVLLPRVGPDRTNSIQRDVRKVVKQLRAHVQRHMNDGERHVHDQRTSWNTAGFVEAFRVHKG